MNEQPIVKKTSAGERVLKWVCGVFIVLFILGTVVANVLYVCQPGYACAVSDLGIVRPKSYYNGPIYKWPGASTIVKYDIRSQVYDFAVESRVAGLQSVKVKGALTYRLIAERVHRILLAYGSGENPRKILIDPLIKGTVNQIVGKRSAEFIITEQEMVVDAIRYIVEDQLGLSQVIEVQDLQLFNPEFAKGFEDAVEARAKAAIETDRVKEEAKQALIRAEAEGKALKIKSDALHNPLIVQYEVAKAFGRWKGTLPSTLILGQGAWPIITGGK